MADANHNATPNFGELMNRLYDAQALIHCASCGLDDDISVNEIRVLSQANATILEVINQLDSMSITSKEAV